jgi:peptidoglycan/LPS O-acetylase OafA/YrhL
MAKSGTDPSAVDPLVDAPPLRTIRTLTGVRFLMSITVFLAHTAVLLPVPWVNEVFDLGGGGGTFFFVLSGFALTWAWRPDDTWTWFVGRRMARIWPTLVLAVALPYGFAITAPGTDILQMTGAALASIFLVQAWIPSVVLEAPNPVTWMLSCIVAFYAVSQLMGRFALRRTPAQLARLAVLALVYGWLLRVVLWIAFPPDRPLALEDAGWLTFGVYSPFGRIHEFALGVLVAAAMRKGWRPRISVGAMLAVLAVVLGVLYLLHDQPFRSLVPHDPLDLVVAPLFALLIAAFTQREIDGRRSVYAAPVMQGLGRLSMAFYLLHFTVIFTIAAVAYPEKGLVDFFLDPPAPDPINWMWTGLALAISMVVSWVVHRFYEDPIERRLRAAMDRRFRRNPTKESAR